MVAFPISDDEAPMCPSKKRWKRLVRNSVKKLGVDFNSNKWKLPDVANLEVVYD